MLGVPKAQPNVKKRSDEGASVVVTWIMSWRGSSARSFSMRTVISSSASSHVIRFQPGSTPIPFRGFVRRSG